MILFFIDSKLLLNVQCISVHLLWISFLYRTIYSFDYFIKRVELPRMDKIAPRSKLPRPTLVLRQFEKTLTKPEPLKINFNWFGAIIVYLL